MRKYTFFAALVLVALFTPNSRAVGGNAYGSRDPKTCSSTRISGAQSSDQARQLFICSTEVDTGSTLYLVDSVNIQVASKSRMYQPGDSYNDVDQSVPVYPIRGSFNWYSCRTQFNIDASHSNVGKNCSVLSQPQAMGICYKTTFGDWKCKMRDPSNHWDVAKTGVAPPQ